MKLVRILLICLTTLLQIQDTLSVFTTVDKQPCPLLKIPNGRVRYRSQKRVARIRCNKTYILMGATTATCIRGTWDVPPPLCIKPNCPTLPKPRNGYWLFEYRRAVSTLICDPGYALIGSGTILCVDSQWNDTVPICETIDSGSQTSCDFETEDICGWTQDLNHNFGWSRQSLATPSGHIGTGPSFDHTLGQGSDGHYMYIESSSRLENDTARLLSPMYQPQLSQNACFVFWYHMYGATTGTLKVNVKLLTDDINNMTTVFSKTGDQGNKWYGSAIHLAPMDQPFQIVIEGIRGRSYASDIAIDDVKLSSGDDCEIITVPPTEFFIQTTPEPSSHTKGIAIISGAVAMVALLAVLVIFIAARRRINLKRRNDMPEDSDVRYLTSDEVLDFSLARPMEEDL
ncbi:neuropilin-1a isoform X3 [Anabrus simplex]|uniref:neuropilin-1a isoform X3 n=1 Tax=Anabrus simplex TaxID=316456 RepID=UPI0035A3D281